MSPCSRKQTPPVNWSRAEANQALKALNEALDAAGITLSSLGLEHAPALSTPLIEWGRARPDVVEELAAVIRKGVEVE